MRTFLLFAFLCPLFAMAQVGIGTSSPSASAKLQVDATNKGFLPPRVELVSTSNTTTPISNPAAGLLVYNTATSGSGGTVVTPGYYFFDGSAWQRVNNGVSAWTDASAISFGAITTAPTVGTPTKSNMRYRRLGEKEWEVVMSFRTDGGGSSTSGTGSYLFTLPAGLSFDLTLPWQTAFTGDASTETFKEFHWNSLPMSSGDMTAQEEAYSSAWAGTFSSSVLIYDATRFRIIVRGMSVATASYGNYMNYIGPWGGDLFPINKPVAGNWTFRFTSQ